MEPDQEEREEQASAEDVAALIREESDLQKRINPVGFIPHDAAEEMVANVLRSGNPEAYRVAREHQAQSITDENSRKARLIQAKEEYEKVRLWLMDNRPARYFVPNVGQEKAFLPMRDINPDEPDIHIGIFGAANAVGKTTQMCAAEAVGLIWGRGELGEFYKNYKIFEKFENVRKQERRPLRFRIIGHSGGMEDGGQIFETITEWWPKGLYRWEKNHKSYYAVCKCWDMDGNVVAIGHVRTHDQPRNAHAGHTLDFILADEPMPKSLWAENVTRLRTKQGGLLWLHATPLDEAGWMKDQLLERPDVHFTQASIWDNCSNWHPDPAMWSGGKVGEGKVLTRGHRARKVFDAMIREWEAEGEAVVEARVNGAFTHLSGAVFKEWDRGFHVIDPFPVPGHWPIYFGLDPHDGKPHFAAWFVQDPNGRLYWAAEYPPEKWSQAKGGVAISQAADAFRAIEAPFRRQIVARVGDPRKLSSPVAGARMSSQQLEFGNEGFDIELGINDVSVGTSRLREYLLRDRHVKDARPWFAVMSHNPWTGAPNTNGVLAFENLTYKNGYSNQDSQADLGSMMSPTWKDPVDVARYVVMRVRDYEPITSLKSVLRKTLSKREKINRSARPWM